MPDIISHLFYQTHSVEYRKVFLKLLERNPNAKLLDLGCSDGEFTIKVAQHIGTKNVCGIDVNMEKVEKARSRGINAFIADLNKPLPFQSESFDVICASDAIEHVYYTDMCIREAYRVLTRGGYTIISTSNLAAIHCIFFLLIGKQPPAADVSDEIAAGTLGRWKKQGSASHYRIFTLQALKELVEHHGFKVEKSVGIGFYPFPIKLANVLSAIDKRHASYICLKARKA